LVREPNRLLVLEPFTYLFSRSIRVKYSFVLKYTCGH
jgi:hypothetical protein